MRFKVVVHYLATGAKTETLTHDRWLARSIADFFNEHTPYRAEVWVRASAMGRWKRA